MVRVEGVAPSRLSALVPKTSVSAYFTTRGWHVVQVLPPARSDLEFVLRKLAPDMLKKKCDRRESHPDHLVGNENSLLFNLRPQKPKRTNTYRV
jgi:hypothetical protein